ncbi:uncharacterized protein LOC141904345 [Tubulanus polymorphus]|uniref:uncharacterized protein LOC141904345 n=1 Tax=Tubulanus polymorphus TaxID=672921 RepID=UPI003DA1D5BB
MSQQGRPELAMGSNRTMVPETPPGSEMVVHGSDFPTTSEQCGDTIFKGQFIPGIVTSHLESARKRVYSSLGESARNNRKNKSKVSKVCRQRSYKCISCGFKCASQSAMGDHQVDKHLEQYMEEIGVESSEPPSSDDDLTSYVDVSTNLKEVIEISSDDCTDDVMNGITNSDEIMNLPSNSTNSTDVSDCIVISDDSEENDDTRSVPMKLYNGDEQLPIFKEGKELDIDTNNHKGLQVKRCEVRLAVFRNHKGLQIKMEYRDRPAILSQPTGEEPETMDSETQESIEMEDITLVPHQFPNHCRLKNLIAVRVLHHFPNHCRLKNLIAVRVLHQFPNHCRLKNLIAVWVMHQFPIHLKIRKHVLN